MAKSIRTRFRAWFSFETDYIRKSSLGDGIAIKLANFLIAKGVPSKALAVNEIYRDDNPEDKRAMYPDISLRYLAAASGVGFRSGSLNEDVINIVEVR